MLKRSLIIMFRSEKGKPAFHSWKRSVPFALLVPTMIWLAVGAPIWLLIIAACLHLFFYALLGIPIFLRYYSIPSAAIWQLHNSIIFAALLGLALNTLLIGLIAFVVQSWPDYLLVGPSYGVVTAIAAHFFGPKFRANKTQNKKSKRAGRSENWLEEETW